MFFYTYMDLSPKMYEYTKYILLIFTRDLFNDLLPTFLATQCTKKTPSTYKYWRIQDQESPTQEPNSTTGLKVWQL